MNLRQDVRMNLKQDVRTLDELQHNPAAVLQDIRRHHRPMIITQKGKPDMVIIPAAMMGKKLKAMQAACELAQV